MGAFKGKVAVVTGSAAGVGRCVALTLATEGASLVCIGGEDTAAEICSNGGTSLAIDSDVSEMSGGEEAIHEALVKFGRLDILINATIGLHSPSHPKWGGSLLNLSAEDFYATVRANLKGTFTTTRHASGVFRKQRAGRIVNITSNAGLGGAGAAARAAVSEGIVGMTRTVGRDLGKYGVTCNAVIADDEAAAAALTGALCTDALSNINGRTLGTKDGSIFLYAEPEIIAGIHKWGPLNLGDLDSLVPRIIDPALRETS